MISFNEKFIGVHTTNVVYRTFYDETFLKEFNDYEKNISKWAALIHDICKRSVPLFNGKDHIHPFISGAALLKIFNTFGIIQLQGQDH